MAFAQHVWNQLKSLTADELIAALKRDNFQQEKGRSAVLIFYRANPPKRITVHYHPSKTYGPKLLQGMIDSAGWKEADLRRLRLIK